MNEIWKNLIPAIIGGFIALLIFFIGQLFMAWRMRRSWQLDYIRTIFAWPKVPQFFSYLIWNIHFLSNIEHLFPGMQIREDNIKVLQDSPEIKHIITEILAYIWVQSKDSIKIALGRDLDPTEFDKALVNSSLVVDRLCHKNIFSTFINSLCSNTDPELNLVNALNKFIKRESNRIYERTSYMNFLLAFACYPKVKKELLELINMDNGIEEKRWEKIEKILSDFLSWRKSK